MMKYIKTFESQNQDNIMKYFKALYSFIQEFFYEQFQNEIKYKINRGVRTNLQFGINNPKGDLMVFFTSVIEGDNRIINGPNYIGVDCWKKSLELEQYLNSLMIYEPDTAYYIVKDWDDLISNLTMKEYNLREEAKKYNL